MTDEPTDAAAEHPLVTVWEAPRATIRRIVDTDPRRAVNLLFFLYGAATALRMSPHLGALAARVWPVVLLVAAAGLVNVPASHVSAWLTRWITRLLGGVASRREIAAAIAWSRVPSIAGDLLLFVAQAAIAGRSLFSDDAPAASPLVTTSLWLGALVAGGWSGIILLVGVAEVSRFSIGRAVATYAIMALLAALVAVAGALAVFSLR